MVQLQLFFHQSQYLQHRKNQQHMIPSSEASPTISESTETLATTTVEVTSLPSPSQTTGISTTEPSTTPTTEKLNGYSSFEHTTAKGSTEESSTTKSAGARYQTTVTETATSRTTKSQVSSTKLLHETTVPQFAETTTMNSKTTGGYTKAPTKPTYNTEIPTTAASINELGSTATTTQKPENAKFSTTETSGKLTSTSMPLSQTKKEYTTNVSTKKQDISTVPSNEPATSPVTINSATFEVERTTTASDITPSITKSETQKATESKHTSEQSTKSSAVHEVTTIVNTEPTKAESESTQIPTTHYSTTNEVTKTSTDSRTVAATTTNSDKSEARTTSRLEYTENPTTTSGTVHETTTKRETLTISSTTFKTPESRTSATPTTYEHETEIPTTNPEASDVTKITSTERRTSDFSSTEFIKVPSTTAFKNDGSATEQTTTEELMSNKSPTQVPFHRETTVISSSTVEPSNIQTSTTGTIKPSAFPSTVTTQPDEFKTTNVKSSPSDSSTTTHSQSFSSKTTLRTTDSSSLPTESSPTREPSIDTTFNNAPTTPDLNAKLTTAVNPIIFEGYTKADFPDMQKTGTSVTGAVKNEANSQSSTSSTPNSNAQLTISDPIIFEGHTKAEIDELTAKFQIVPSSSRISLESQTQGRLLSMANNNADAGYAVNEMIISCTYNMISCDLKKDFAKMTDPWLGNCYTFNYDSKHLIVGSGHKFGLKIVAFSNVTEYLPTTSISGMKVVVHKQNFDPFPNNEGIYAGVGSHVTANIRYKSCEQLTAPYGVCRHENDTAGYIYDGRYRIEGCYRSCFQQRIIDACECADPRFPKPRELNISWCDVTNQIRFTCYINYLTTKGDFTNVKDCVCPHGCTEPDYTIDVSRSKYPIAKFNFTTPKCWGSFSNTEADNCYKSYKENAVAIDVTYKTLTLKIFKTFKKNEKNGDFSSIFNSN